MDLGRVEDQVAGVQAVEVRAVKVQEVAGVQAVEVRAVKVQEVVGVQAVEVRAATDQVEARVVKAQAVRAVGVQAVEDRAAQGQAADRASADRVAVRQRLACGPELATAAARHLFPEWWPALRAEPLAGAASPQRKSSSGFSAR